MQAALASEETVLVKLGLKTGNKLWTILEAISLAIFPTSYTGNVKILH